MFNLLPLSKNLLLPKIILVLVLKTLILNNANESYQAKIAKLNSSSSMMDEPVFSSENFGLFTLNYKLFKVLLTK